LTSGVDLDGDVRRADPGRWLASRFISDAGRRADVIGLYALDHELARAETAATNPLAAEIRLVWWLETIAEIFAGQPPRRHPTAEALAGVIVAHDLPEANFEAMIEARIDGIGRQALTAAEAVAWAGATEGRLAGIAATVLGAGNLAKWAEPAGKVWGLVLLRRARRTSGVEREIRETLEEARAAARRLPTLAFPAALAATLARADLRTPCPSDLEMRFRLAFAALSGAL
jgi:phytoene synthase